MNQVRARRFALWSVLAAGWTSAFLVLSSLVGGVQWLAHTGHVRPALLNLLMAALCAAAAIQGLRGVALRAPLPLFIAIGAVLHMLNILGFFLLQTPLALPFYWLATVLPTNPYVIPASNLSVPVALVAIWLLPVATLVAAIRLKAESELAVGERNDA